MIKRIIIISPIFIALLVSGQVIVTTEESPLIKMAAKEVRRYTYLRTGKLPKFKYS